jgi:hypothetical protein
MTFTTLTTAADDLTSRAFAAARLQMRGDSYSPEDRAECAASIVGAVLADGALATGRCYCGGPAAKTTAMAGPAAGMLPALLTCHRHARGIRSARTIRPDLTVPSFSRLYGQAANYRRGLDRMREREAADAATRAASDAFLPHLEHAPDEVRATAEGAHRHALEMSDALGYRGDYGAYVAAYCAARTWAGMDSAEVAEELGMPRGTVRSYVSRWAGKLPSAGAKWTRQDGSVGEYGIPAHADALHVPTGGTEKSTATRMGDGTREHIAPDAHAPVLAYAAGTTRPARQPDWARDLPRATRERLSKADEIRRARTDARSETERAAIRREVGIPATVL